MSPAKQRARWTTCFSVGSQLGSPTPAHFGEHADQKSHEHHVASASSRCHNALVWPSSRRLWPPLVTRARQEGFWYGWFPSRERINVHLSRGGCPRPTETWTQKSSTVWTLGGWSSSLTDFLRTAARSWHWTQHSCHLSGVTGQRGEQQLTVEEPLWRMRADAVTPSWKCMSNNVRSTYFRTFHFRSCASFADRLIIVRWFIAVFFFFFCEFDRLVGFCGVLCLIWARLAGSESQKRASCQRVEGWGGPTFFLFAI